MHSASSIFAEPQGENRTQVDDYNIRIHVSVFCLLACFSIEFNSTDFLLKTKTKDSEPSSRISYSTRYMSSTRAGPLEN